MYKFIPLLLLILLTGCAGHQQGNKDLANSLYYQNPQTVLEQLQCLSPNSHDNAQFHLNLGLLQFMAGDFFSAINTLTYAKQEMQRLSASSVSENIAAGTINEQLRSYSGYPTDKVMVHNILALSYLFSNDISGARVEMLQADIAMKKLVKGKDVSGQLASAHLLAAIIYELLDEQADALISYKDAADIIEQRGLALPLGVKLGLLRMSYKLGAKRQYRAYKKRFPNLSVAGKNNKKQVFSLYFDGVVTQKEENSITVPHHSGQLIRIAMPYYPPVKHSFGKIKIDQKKTQLIENLDSLVRDDLNNEYPSILLLTTTRALAKYELVKEAEKQDELLGALVNMATLLTEAADLRSWNMLPANIQFAYLETDKDEVIVNDLKKIVIADSSKNVLFVNSLSDDIFHYKQ